MIQQRETATALDRIGDVSDVTGVAKFLASDQADHVTGLALSISDSNRPDRHLVGMVCPMCQPTRRVRPTVVWRISRLA
jgi:hypothetical protein